MCLLQIAGAFKESEALSFMKSGRKSAADPGFMDCDPAEPALKPDGFLSICRKENELHVYCADHE